MESVQKSAYRKPERAIFVNDDLERFTKSKAYRMIVIFVKHLCASIRGKKRSDDYVVSTKIESIQRLLSTINAWIDEIPPIDQPMRFGNKAYREWFDRLSEQAGKLLKDILPPDQHSSVVEIEAYLKESFGNRVRIDYGTGHEANFILFLCCLHHIGFIKEQDFPAAVLVLFYDYIKIMRRLQTIYMLEPAGSHGVWGLDDYQCLVFYFGASQLCDQVDIVPESIHDDNVLENCAEEYLYLGGIKFIKEVKKGSPFAETSPMLNDISGVHSWEKITQGMLKLYENEVLRKLPVIQHTLFGSMLPCTWPHSSPEVIAPKAHSGVHPGTKVHKPNFDLEGVCCKAPWVDSQTVEAEDDTKLVKPST